MAGGEGFFGWSGLGKKLFSQTPGNRILFPDIQQDFFPALIAAKDIFSPNEFFRQVFPCKNFISLEISLHQCCKASSSVVCVASVSNRVIVRKLERHFFCSCPNFLDELAQKRLLRRLLHRFLLLFVASSSWNRYWDYKLPCLPGQIKLSSTFVCDYEMSTCGSSARNSHLSQWYPCL